MAPALAFVESNTSGTGPLFAGMARQLGCEPVLLTADPGRYPFLARQPMDVVGVDTADRAALLAACRDLAARSGLAGITSSSEYFIAGAAALAHEAGLPGPDAAAVEACRDKAHQRARLAGAGIGVPAFRVVASAEEAAGAAADLGLPVVVKPAAGTGSMQVRLCREAGEVRQAAGLIVERRHNERGMPLPRHFLVESFLLGPEHSVETFGLEVVGLTRKHLGQPPHFVETGHDFPAALAQRDEERLRRTALGALKALGLGWGPAHVELKLTAEGPRIVEVNPRLAGGFIPELVRLATGIDLIRETLRAVLGEPVDLRPGAIRHAAIRFLIPPGEGVLEGVEGIEEARELPGIAAVEVYLPPGKEIRLHQDFRDRMGHVLACADGPGEAALRAEQGRDAVRCRLAALPG